MPPKAPVKIRAENKPPATPEKPKSKPKAETATPTKTPNKTPSKKKESVAEFKPLDKDATGLPVPIDVSYDRTVLGEPRIKGGFGKLLRLQAPSAFTVTKSIMLTEGDYAGHQAIIIRPAKPFNFVKISPEARNLVYRYYFAADCIANGPILVDSKRTSNKEPYAKTFANGSKNRVAILAVSKEIHKEAAQIFYALPIRFENTGTVMDFFTTYTSLRERVTSVEIKLYQKTSSRNALHLLSEAKNLTRLSFESGVTNESDPVKAAKAFWNDSYKFLQAVGTRREDKDNTKAIEVLNFHEDALTMKDESKKNDKNATEPWSDDMIEDFKQALVAKLMTDALRAWTCICGTTVGTPHRCEDVMDHHQRNLDTESWMHLQHGGAAMFAELPKVATTTMT